MQKKKRTKPTPQKWIVDRSTSRYNKPSKNTGENLCKSTVLKEKTGKLDLIKLKVFVPQKLPLRQSKDNFRLRENVCKSYLIKGFI